METDTPEKRVGWGTLACTGVDSDSSKKCGVGTDFEFSRKVAKTFQAGMVVLTVVLAGTGQRQDEFKAWAVWSETLPQLHKTLRDAGWLSSEERAEVGVERLPSGCVFLSLPPLATVTLSSLWPRDPGGETS